MSRYRDAWFKTILGTLVGQWVLRLQSTWGKGWRSLDKPVLEQARTQTVGQATFPLEVRTILL